MDRANESQDYVDRQVEKLNGYGVFTYSNGDIYEGEWWDDNKNGNGKYVWSNGDIYDGEWWKDKRNGKGKSVWSNGNIYEGEWWNDKPNGVGILIYSDGNKYEGEWENDRKNGMGTYIYSNGDKYEGEWDNNKKSGLGILTHSNGDKYEGEWSNDSFNRHGLYYWSDGARYDGEWKNGKKNGLGRMVYSSGNIYDGEWRNNKKNGIGIAIWIDGDEYQGEWKEDKRTGKGILRYSDGAKYEGEWKNNKRNGIGTLTHSNGTRYDGEWKCGKKDGIGTMIYSIGDKYEGEWRDDKENGQGILTYIDGDKYEGEWKEGKKNGQGILTYSDGNIYDGEWKDGKINGKGKYTYSNGDVYEGDFKDGYRCGRGIYIYNSEGGVKSEGEWKEGKKTGIGTLTFQNGSKYEGEWKDDNRYGRGISINSDGDKYDGEWKDNKENGFGIINYSNGDKFEGEFKDGKHYGKCINVWPDGSIYEGEFINGERYRNAIYTDSSGNKRKQYYEDGKLLDRNLLIEICGTSLCQYTVRLKKMESILYCIKPLQPPNSCNVKINDIYFKKLNDLIKYTFNNLIADSGYIMIRTEVPDFHLDENLNEFSNMIWKFISTDNIEFMAQCINYNYARLKPEITTILICIKKKKKNLLVKQVRFITMADKLESGVYKSCKNQKWEYFGVPFSREECLSKELFNDISIDKVDSLYPWEYVPLNNSEFSKLGIEIGEFMEISKDSYQGKVKSGIDYEKYLLSVKNQFDPHTKYVFESEEKFSDFQHPYYLRRIITESAILYCNINWDSFQNYELEPLLVLNPQEPIFTNIPSDSDHEYLISIQVKNEWKERVDIEYIYLETRKPEFKEQFYYYQKGNYHFITIQSTTILKAKIGELPSIEVQREIVQKEKKEYFEDLKKRLQDNEKAFGINKGDISHSIGSPLRSIKALTGYLYEYFESENSPIPIDTIIKQSAHTYSIRRTLDKIYEEVIKGENWIKGIGLDLSKPLERANINSQIIYQLEKCNQGGYKFSVRNQVSGLEHILVDVNNNFELILENLLSNANRHAFKERSEKNIVEFSSSIVSFNNRNYLNISISNNGFPMEVSLKDYISYGIKGKTSGNSGIGGSNIYDIVKSYQGFLGLKKGYEGFSVTFDILLPIADEYLPNNKIKEYEPDEIE